MFVGNVELRRVEDPTATEMMMRIKMYDEYEHIKDVPDQVTEESLSTMQGCGFRSTV
jgi:hypothetical protein